jgi:ABC-2 type transport system permease protein
MELRSTLLGYKRYLSYITMSLKERSNFRIDFFIRLTTSFISSYARVAVWVVIIGADAMAHQTIRYMVLMSAASSIIYSYSGSVFQRIQDGDIARDLLYPVSFPVTLFWRALGSSFAGLLQHGLPTMVVLTLLLDIQWSFSAVQILLFVIFSLTGFALNFFITKIVDMAAFWLYEIRGLQYIMDAVQSFFAGGFIPLWFYPAWILPVIDWLPFKYTMYVPLAFALGELAPSEAWFYLALCGGWCVAFGVLMTVVWRAGVKKTVINGG